MEYTEEMENALKHAQHILESACLTTEGFEPNGEMPEDDGCIRVCISNVLEETGDEPPYTKPKKLTLELFDGLFEKLNGLPPGYTVKVKQVGRHIINGKG